MKRSLLFITAIAGITTSICSADYYKKDRSGKSHQSEARRKAAERKNKRKQTQEAAPAKTRSSHYQNKTSRFRTRYGTKRSKGTLNEKTRAIQHKHARRNSYK